MHIRKYNTHNKGNIYYTYPAKKKIQIGKIPEFFKKIFFIFGYLEIGKYGNRENLEIGIGICICICICIKNPNWQNGRFYKNFFLMGIARRGGRQNWVVYQIF